MRKLVLALALFAIAGCSSDSGFPNPTGKGTIRAINAMNGSPDVSFLIEERPIDTVAYQESSVGQRFDDFEYNFNFDISFFGDNAPRRVASILQKVDADRDYTFVATGDFNNPTITVWETDERLFDAADTVFEARFAHMAPTLGSIDMYFTEAGMAPVMGEQQGTLVFGEELVSIDFAESDYVLTITLSGGDPINDAIYQSEEITYLAQASLILAIFEPNENDPSPWHVSLINTNGGNSAAPDALTEPTIRFFQASMTLGPSDIYDDEMLMNQIVPNHVFGDVTGDIDVPVGEATYTYTPVGNTGMVQFEDVFTANRGTHNNFIIIGDMDNRTAVTYTNDRRSVGNIVSMRVFHAALNNEDLDLYVVDSGTTVDETARTLGIEYSLLTPQLAFDAGDYDIYVTLRGEKTIVAGPVSISAALGDVYEVVVFDVVDPAMAEVRIIPAP